MDKINILIVEDEAIVAMDLAARLQKMGFNMTRKATTGREAIEIFKKENPDLVLMDIHLRGEWDGIKTAQCLNEMASIPIIYLTAQIDTPTIERAKQTLPAAYLTKPFDERSLQIAIELAIHNFAFRKNLMPEQSLSSPQYLTQNVAEKTDKSLNADSILVANDIVFIKQNYKFVKIQIDELIYLQVDNIYTDLITSKHKYSLRLTLNQVIEKLNVPHIVQVHRSYAVNMLHVEAFNTYEIVIGSLTIPLSASFKEKFLNYFNFK